MNNDIEKVSKSIVVQETKDHNSDLEIKPEAIAKPEASDVLLEYEANGFRVPTE